MKKKRFDLKKRRKEEKKKRRKEEKKKKKEQSHIQKTYSKPQLFLFFLFRTLTVEEEFTVINYLIANKEKSNITLNKKVIEEASKRVGKDWRLVKDRIFELLELYKAPLPIRIHVNSLENILKQEVFQGVEEVVCFVCFVCFI